MKKISAFIIFFTALLALSAYGEGIEITPPSGFYEDAVSVEVTIPDDETAYYSLDGSAENGVPLNGAIQFDNTGDFSAHTLRVWTESGLRAEAAYVVGSGVTERFDMYVAVVDTTDADLYDYDIGILVEGRIWDEYDELYPESTVKPARHPANYNQRTDEWVRNSYVTIFDQSGTPLVSQAAGLSVMGGASSAKYQKSLKVSADELYDPDHDDFVIDFFVSDSFAPSATRTITEFNNLVFRNSGNDFNHTWIRWNLMSELAKRAGFQVVQPATPCVLFLNGKYYGLTQLQPTASRKFVADSVGIADQSLIEVHKIGDQTIYDEIGLTDLVTADFSDPAAVTALNEVIDVEQMLRYYAFQTVVNNCDWPAGNVYMWRYTGKNDPSNPATDGRWRYVLYDLDYCYDVYDEDREIFDRLWQTSNPIRSFFKNLMQDPGLRAEYLANVYQLMNQIFVESDVVALVETLDAQIAAEVTEKSPVETVRQRDHQRYIDQLISEINGRRAALSAKLEEYLGCETKYALAIADPGLSATVTLCGVDITSAIEGEYYVEAGATVACRMHTGWEFLSWTVNGETVTDAQFSVTGEMASQGRVDITLNAAQTSCGPVIWALAAKDDEDFVEIMNPGGADIYLGNIFISDDPEKPDRQRLPEITLRPGESIVVAASGGDYALNFGIKKGETVLLTHENGTIYDAVPVPKMGSGDVYARYGGGKFAFYRISE